MRLLALALVLVIATACYGPWIPCGSGDCDVATDTLMPEATIAQGGTGFLKAFNAATMHEALAQDADIPIASAPTDSSFVRAAATQFGGDLTLALDMGQVPSDRLASSFTVKLRVVYGSTIPIPGVFVTINTSGGTVLLSNFFMVPNAPLTEELIAHTVASAIPSGEDVTMTLRFPWASSLPVWLTYKANIDYEWTLAAQKQFETQGTVERRVAKGIVSARETQGNVSRRVTKGIVSGSYE